MLKLVAIDFRIMIYNFQQLVISFASHFSKEKVSMFVQVFIWQQQLFIRFQKILEKAIVLASI